MASSRCVGDGWSDSPQAHVSVAQQQWSPQQDIGAADATSQEAAYGRAMAAASRMESNWCMINASV